MSSTAYALITPARNEEAFIEKTLQSVVAQTVLPRRWVIVSDGSTDRTDEIIAPYARRHGFIQPVRIDGHGQRTFASKVHAFQRGCEQLEGVAYDFIGMLDADVSFAPDYYEKVLHRFHQEPRLGVAGGIRFDWNGARFVRVACAQNSVGGPFQLFRRQCFEQIGGFTAIPGGGEDAVAESMARLLGWQVASFEAMPVYHHRRTGTAVGKAWGVHFRDGKKFYLLGYHPLFQLVKSVFRCKDRPYLLSGVLLMCGYLAAALRRPEKPVSSEFVRKLRGEQLMRLRTLLLRGQDPALRRNDG